MDTADPDDRADHGATDHPGAANPEQPPGLAEASATLEATRRAAFADPRLIDVPGWWWPVFGVTFGVFVSVQASDAGGLVLLGVTVVYLATLGGLVRAITVSRGVTGPRLSAMPPELRRTYWPVWMVGLAVLAVLIVGWVTDVPLPPWVVGAGAGIALTLTGMRSVASYRRVAQRLVAGSADGR